MSAPSPSPVALFHHSVYFWLRDGGTPEASHRDALALAEGCRTHLSGIPGIRRLSVGFPAGTPREVVDNSYGVALLITFEDQAAHDVYQGHPDHQRFIAECHPLWSRVQIYDSIE